MIADKAAYHYLDELEEYCIEERTIGLAYIRNVIPQWRQTSHNNSAEFSDKIKLFGFDERETCVGVHSKKKELKILARLFGLATIEKRPYT